MIMEVISVLHVRLRGDLHLKQVLHLKKVEGPIFEPTLDRGRAAGPDLENVCARFIVRAASKPPSVSVRQSLVKRH